MGAFKYNVRLLQKRATLGWIFGIHADWTEGQRRIADLTAESFVGKCRIVDCVFYSMVCLIGPGSVSPFKSVMFCSEKLLDP